ncbi:MAG TPA: hypothetical protein DIC53_00385 [Synergistaceae bacterium]|nr:hypothetical protein [Synergistaceae bacterium]
MFGAKKILMSLLSALLLMLSGSGTANAGGIVLALSGGGSRGLAHIGVIEALQEAGIPVAGIVGTSMGAVSGGLVASGYSPRELREILSGIDMENLLAERSNPLYVPQGRQGPVSKARISWFTVTEDGKAQGPSGILAGVGLLERFSELVARVDVSRFDELPIPFAAVATDLETGNKVVLRSGSLASAMRASMAIPGVFAPWPMGDTKLVDGGIVSNLPVDTAQEVFPGYPVVAVDVTEALRDGDDIRSAIDVVEQSLTILTRQNVQDEIKRADFVISPQTAGQTMLDFSRAEEIIDGGYQATLPHVAAIRRLADTAPPVAQMLPIEVRSVVSAIRVEGADARLAGRIVAKYSAWMGRTVDMRAVNRASRELAQLENIQAVEYRLDEVGPNVEVVFMVNRRPKLEIGVGGYTTNLHPYRWLYIQGVRRGLLHDDDALYFNLRAGEQWGIDLNYLTDSDFGEAWEIFASAQKWEIDTLNKGHRSWRRYALGAAKRFALGPWGASIGFAAEYVDGERWDDDSYGPTFSLVMNTLNSATDPTSGSLFQFQSWWPDGEEILYRATYFKAMRLAGKWRAYLRLGFAEGDERRDGRHGVFLGAAEELYSYANNPIQGERMAWANVAFRLMGMKNWWGGTYMELFGGYGHVYGDGGERLREAWEAGLALSVPIFLLDGKLFFLYDDEGDFKVGFTIGTPVWGHYPLP